jgi:hypothetical protein
MAEFEAVGRPKMYGTKVRGKRYKCGGWTGCDELHEFFEPKDVLVLTEAQRVEELITDDHTEDVQAKLERAVERGTLYRSTEFVVPTRLGDWWEDCSVN